MLKYTAEATEPYSWSRLPLPSPLSSCGGYKAGWGAATLEIPKEFQVLQVPLRTRRR